MPDVRFDPSKAITFDLTQGLVHLAGPPRSSAGHDPTAGASQVVVPSTALMALAAAAGAEATEAFARALGTAMGHRIADRVSGATATSSVEVVVEQLAGELAVAGLGSLILERWGHAAVVAIDRSPLGAAGDPLLASLVGAAIEEAVGGGRRVHAVLLGREGARARVLLGGSSGADRVRAWLAEGVAWADALVRLHAPSQAPRGET
jgi:hypothetical protein